MVEEEWRPVRGFSHYQISSLGRIYNTKFDHFMSISENNFGVKKITLVAARTGIRYTKAVAYLVAEAFVEPPNRLCDHVIMLDGDTSNLSAQNVAWRPRWYAQRYTRQLTGTYPHHYRNLPVKNLSNKVRYGSIIEAGMTEGLLFDDIWRSTYTGSAIFPYGDVFKIIGV